MARTIEFDIEVNGLDELAQSGLSARQQLKLLQEALNNEKLSVKNYNRLKGLLVS